MQRTGSPCGVTCGDVCMPQLPAAGMGSRRRQDLPGVDQWLLSNAERRDHPAAGSTGLRNYGRLPCVQEAIPISRPEPQSHFEVLTYGLTSTTSSNTLGSIEIPLTRK